ncbi:MAG TPA: glycosyltransferase [Chitinispirillaceae bacterium]|nr:glycosyltransferase [Chitinispirillaceae bacterium]
MDLIRITHVTHSFLPVTQNWIFNQIRFNDGIRSAVICMTRDNPIQFPHPEVYPVFKTLNSVNKIKMFFARLWLWQPYRQYEDLIGKTCPQIIHGHFSPESCRILPLIKNTALPLVTTFYGVDINKLPRRRQWRKRYSHLFSRGNLFIVEGSHMANALEKTGCPKEKIRVIKIGVDCELIDSFSKNRKSDSESINLLFVGLEREKKGASDMVKAFVRLAAEYPAVNLHLIGEGKYKSKIKETLQNNGFENRAIFHGYVGVNRYLELLSESDIVMVPSCTAHDGDTEGGAPVVCIEAQVAQKPVVGTFHCDIPEIVVHEKTGLLCPEHDIDRLTVNLKLLIENKKLRKEMGRNAGIHARRNHDIKKQVKLLNETYYSLIKNPEKT